jgi:hypothetical protein
MLVVHQWPLLGCLALHTKQHTIIFCYYHMHYLVLEVNVVTLRMAAHLEVVSHFPTRRRARISKLANKQ